MKKKNINAEFYVFNLDTENKIYRRNIITTELTDRIYKEVKKGKIKTFEELRHEIRMYYSKYWSRVQFEFMVSGMMENLTNIMKKENRNYSIGKKVDVFYQIEKNLNIITEILINRMELDIPIPKKYSTDKEFWEKGNVMSESLNF